MDISIYSSAFNLLKCKFDYEFAIDNFCNFAEEVVISTINDSDNSYEILNKFKSKYNNLNIVLTDLQPNFPAFDGALKDAALQNTFNPVKLSLDLDEYIPLNHKEKWKFAAQQLQNSVYDCFMVPVIDIYKDMNHCKGVGFKWRLHKTGLKRGVVNFAKRENGSHDINKSDSCELLNHLDNLVPCLYLIDPNLTTEQKLSSIKESDCIYVHHLGYLDIERRDHINKEFWQEMWNTENGFPVQLDNLNKLQQYKSYKHGLEI